MIQVYVKLDVKDFAALDVFERQAVSIMKQYHGKVVAAFETVRREDGTGEGIHILEFPTEEDFAGYRLDDDLRKLSALREQAIAATEVKIALKNKSYENI